MACESWPVRAGSVHRTLAIGDPALLSCCPPMSWAQPLMCCPSCALAQMSTQVVYLHSGAPLLQSPCTAMRCSTCQSCDLSQILLIQEISAFDHRENCRHPGENGTTKVPSVPKLLHYSTLFWTINFGHRNVKITSHKLSWNFFLAPLFLQGI